MNVRRAPRHVVFIPSAKTSRGGTGAAACLDSLLPREMTGSLQSQVLLPAQTSMNASSAGSVQSTRNVPIPWEATVAAAKLDSSLKTPSVKMRMNVPIPELAQSRQLATTVLEATLVSATQDLNPAVDR